jgi:hypothetical protein
MREKYITQIKFRDYEAEYRDKVNATLIIDKFSGTVTFRSDKLVSIESISMILAANKHVRKFTWLNRDFDIIRGSKDDNIFICDDDGLPVYTKPIGIFDLDISTTSIGPISYKELEKLCNWYHLSIDDIDKVNRIRKQIIKKYDLEFVRLFKV